MLALLTSLSVTMVYAADDHGHAAPKAEEAAASEAKGGTKPSKPTPERGKAASASEEKARGGPMSMDELAEKLAEKLNAVRPESSSSRYVMRVSNQGEEKEEAAGKPGGKAKPVVRKKAAPKEESKSEHEEPPAHAAAHPPHWDYEGEDGPTHWSKLAPEYAQCGRGTRQSPIDIRDGIPVQLPPIEFDYRSSGFNVLDNGHTIQVAPGQGNGITVNGHHYDLVQFHFHRPSEERINGKPFDMVMHLVHKDSEGHLAVVAVMLEHGPTPQPEIQAVWNALPLERGSSMTSPVPIDLNKLLPDDRRYATFMGSLTTPPCSEGVLWMVLKKPVMISQEQVNIFARLYPMNARPLQPVSGRLIKDGQ